MRVCSFTGHRQIKRTHTAPLTELLDRAVEYAYSQGCRLFLSGGAVGFDTLAARRVLAFRVTHPDVELELVLPCLNQDEKWTDPQKDAYAFLLSRADRIRYVAEEYSEGCMRERNAILASEADLLIAYISRPSSGSAQTARMAEKLGKRVYNLYPAADGL